MNGKIQTAQRVFDEEPWFFSSCGALYRVSPMKKSREWIDFFWWMPGWVIKCWCAPVSLTWCLCHCYSTRWQTPVGPCVTTKRFSGWYNSSEELVLCWGRPYTMETRMHVFHELCNLCAVASPIYYGNCFSATKLLMWLLYLEWRVSMMNVNVVNDKMI
jgi:hypothetical protein